MLALARHGRAAATNQRAGVDADLKATVASGRAPIPWGWYQEGYISPTAAAEGYEAHHNGLQYFGYLRNNEVFWKNVHDAKAMLAQLRAGTLGDQGVFYVKGSSKNEFGWKPANPDPSVQANWLGDDDHPGYGDSDAQIGESFVATFVNAIARSKYWNDSAIVDRLGRQRRILGPRSAAELRTVRRRPSVRRRQPNPVSRYLAVRTQRCDRAGLRRHRFDREVCRDRIRPSGTRIDAGRETLYADGTARRSSHNHGSERRFRSGPVSRYHPADPRERR